jgi:CRP-like cAMP-binding protein
MAETGLFAGIPKEQIAALVRLSQRRDFESRETIVRSSETANRFFLIKAGCVDYFVHTLDGREILLQRLVSGGVFGFGAFFAEPEGYLGTVVACRTTSALVWPHQAISTIAHGYPRFVENALHIAFSYFAVYMQRHLVLVSRSARDRLALSLLNLAHDGTTRADGVEVLVTNEMLASLADVNSYTASRTLKQWERNGVLIKAYGKILLKCPEKLLSCNK